MGHPAYVFSNLIESASLTSSTANSNYPLANLKDRIKAKPFKFTAAGGYVEADFGSTKNFDTAAIIGHNMPASLVASVKAGASPNPGATEGTPLHRTEDLWAKVGTVGSVPSVNARYARVTVSCPGAVTSWGELIIGKRCELPRAPRWLIPKGKAGIGITHRSYGGVTWDYEFYENGLLGPSFRFPESEYAAFQLFSDRVGRRPFLWIPDVGKSDVYYVKKQRGFDPIPVGPAMDSLELLYNGGAEIGTIGTQVDGWTFQNGASALAAEDQRHDGIASIKIASIAQDSYSYEFCSLLAGKIYELSGWIKTDTHSNQPSGYALLQLGSSGITILEKTIIGSDPNATLADCGLPLDGVTRDWTFVRCRFRQNITETIPIYVRIGYGATATATAWFDQVSLKEVNSLQHWYDWTLNLELESSGLLVNA